MPELPEVETIAAALRPRLVGRRLVGWWRSRFPMRSAGPTPADRQRALDRRIIAVTRRGRYLILALSNRQAIVIHLGMSGALVLHPPPTSSACGGPTRHDHHEWRFDDGSILRFNDPRRFGGVEVMPLRKRRPIPLELDRRLGPEPLSAKFTAPTLATAVTGRRTPIKVLLMDNRIVTGVGNIYASESLHRAGIDPRRPGGSLTAAETAGLVRAVRAVIRAAIRAGGTTIADYRSIDGSLGRFSHHLRVYGRDGEPCPRCRNRVIHRTVLGRRSTFHCPSCQPSLAPKRRTKRGRTGSCPENRQPSKPPAGPKTRATTPTPKRTTRRGPPTDTGANRAGRVRARRAALSIPPGEG